MKTSLTGQVKYNKYFVKCTSLDFISIASNELWTLMPEVNEMPRDILFTSCFNDIFPRLYVRGVMFISVVREGCDVYSGCT